MIDVCLLLLAFYLFPGFCLREVGAMKIIRVLNIVDPECKL